MRTRLLLLTLLPSMIACGAEPATLQLHSHISSGPRPGEAGTLLELGDPRQSIRAIALSSNYVYFAVDWAGVYRMPKYGGDIAALQEDRNALFRHLATDADRVYWDHITFPSDDDPANSLHTQVRSQSLAGGASTTIAEGNFGIYDGEGIEASGGRLYWMSYPAGSTAASLERVSATGGPRDTMIAFGDYNSAPDWVVDDAGIYFTTLPAGQGRVDDCAVEELSAPGQGPATLAPCPTPDSAAAGSDADVVYVQSGQAVWQVSKRSRNTPVTAIQTLPDGSNFSGPAAFDESNVYVKVYSDSSAWTWVTFPKAGGAMTALADASLCPNIGGSWATAADGQYLYVVCGSFDRIVVVPKPPVP